MKKIQFNFFHSWQVPLLDIYLAFSIFNVSLTMRGITANAVLFLLFDGIMVDGFVIQGKFYGQR